MAVYVRFLCRHDGLEANDGEVGCAKDSPGDEENDLRGDRRLQRHHQLQGLCENDAWQAISCSQTVSVCVCFRIRKRFISKEFVFQYRKYKHCADMHII